MSNLELGWSYDEPLCPDLPEREEGLAFLRDPWLLPEYTENQYKVYMYKHLLWKNSEPEQLNFGDSNLFVIL
jgi:hypothetical protein